MKKLILTSLVLMAMSMEMNAELKLKHPTGDHMVLQQQTEAVVWGFAAPGKDVTVKTSWDGKSYKGKADASGEWKVKVQTPAASYTAYTLDINGDGGHIVVKDVLVGEVWLASGQSNMEIPLRGFDGCPIENYNEVVTQAPARNKVRMLYAHADQTDEPLQEVRNTEGWECADPNSIPEMSAVGYFFARKLNEVLDIPVGIVAFPRGGSRVESWLPREILAGYGTEDLTPEGVAKMQGYTRPFQMYYAMEYPLRGYTARGFIWYQGCSNVGKHDEFVSRMQDLVKLFRSDWGDKNNEMPFYMVEIAPYLYSRNGGDSGAWLRHAQLEASKAIPNSALVSTNDLVAPYEAANIHPCRKEPIGNRLAYIALNRNYGFERVKGDSPEATAVAKFEAPRRPNAPAQAAPAFGQLAVTLENAREGLDRTEEIEGLEICGKDGVWKPVTSVRFMRGSMVVSSPEVAEPCEVRYGWGDYKPGNIHNVYGLPLFPFWLKLQ